MTASTELAALVSKAEDLFTRFESQVSQLNPRLGEDVLRDRKAAIYKEFFDGRGDIGLARLGTLIEIEINKCEAEKKHVPMQDLKSLAEAEVRGLSHLLRVDKHFNRNPIGRLALARRIEEARRCMHY